MRLVLVFFSIVIIFGAAQASDKVDGYICDDGISDDGYQVIVSDLDEQHQHIVVLKKTKMALEYVADSTLILMNKTGKFRSYSDNKNDDNYVMTISVPDVNGRRSAVFFYTDKKSRTRIPEVGNIICQPK